MTSSVPALSSPPKSSFYFVRTWAFTFTESFSVNSGRDGHPPIRNEHAGNFLLLFSRYRCLCRREGVNLRLSGNTFSVFFFFLKNMFLEREREAYIGCLPNSPWSCPDWGSNQQSRDIPWLGIEPKTLPCTGWPSKQLNHTCAKLSASLYFPPLPRVGSFSSHLDDLELDSP